MDLPTTLLVHLVWIGFGLSLLSTCFNRLNLYSFHHSSFLIPIVKRNNPFPISTTKLFWSISWYDEIANSESKLSFPFTIITSFACNGMHKVVPLHNYLLLHVYQFYYMYKRCFIIYNICFQFQHPFIYAWRIVTCTVVLFELRFKYISIQTRGRVILGHSYPCMHVPCL